jgi:hypothetical protein
MKEIAFSFVSLQQQRPDLPRLLVSTSNRRLFSLSLSLSSWHAGYLLCLLHDQARSYLAGGGSYLAVMCISERANLRQLWALSTPETLQRHNCCIMTNSSQALRVLIVCR